MKSKRTYKIIACVSIWLSIIIAFFALAIAKPKAGVIIESNFTAITNRNFYEIDDGQDILNNKYCYGIKRAQLNEGFDGIQMTNLYDNLNNLICQIRLKQIAFEYYACTIGTTNLTTYARNLGLSAGSWRVNTSDPLEIVDKGNESVYLIFSLENLFKGFREAGATVGANGNILDNNNLTLHTSTFSFGISGSLFTKNYTISSAQNLYDLEQNDVALIYLSDISGLNTAAYRDEITINWGYIDSNDNTLFTVHAPKVQAQRTDNNIISLAMPINAAGDATSYYSIDQSAILSTISTGGATATAHIYGIYVWAQQSRIQWGLAEFDTSGLPASGASMNYITSLTSLYDYTAANTSTMTCRLSISNNFNFITIKNQPILSAYNINTVIQQGGFLPAWAVYNWARGSSAGYTSGEQAGAAPYQPGAAGYEEIYEAGRQAGIAENIGTVNWFVSAFQAVDAMLNIRIFPNITIGYLVGIPFVISVVWFVIRMFRGGGSSS